MTKERICPKRVESRDQFADVWPVLSGALYHPGPERYQDLLKQYTLGEAELWAVWDASGPAAVVGVRQRDGAGEITHIAVRADIRGRGVGGRLIRWLRFQYQSVTTWTAETDDDAVGFYRALGFLVEALPSRYPDVVRYRCVYIQRWQ